MDVVDADCLKWLSDAFSSSEALRTATADDPVRLLFRLYHLLSSVPQPKHRTVALFYLGKFGERTLRSPDNLPLGPPANVHEPKVGI